jgi:hypothetical protein
LSGTLLLLSGCRALHTPETTRLSWEDPRLVEASGLIVLTDSEILVSHNDDRDSALYLANSRGMPVSRLSFPELQNRDWEDLALIERKGQKPLVVIGEVGDNQGRYSSVFLHFVEVGGYELNSSYVGSLEVLYPDGPRDVESIAWDAEGGRILLLSKRDRPARLYAVPLPEFLPEGKQSVQVPATFLGEVAGIPRPTPDFIATNPKYGRWSGQPTGMDINRAGNLAAVITYNDLHFFRRKPDQTWAEAMAEVPESLDIPLLGQTEAVGFTPDGKAVYIVPEGANPDILRVELPE